MNKFQFALMALASMIYTASTQPKEVGITVIGNAREFVEAAQAKEQTIRQVLEQAVPQSVRHFIVVARRQDCWIGEFQSKIERMRLLANAAVVISDAAQFPVFDRTAASVAGVKRQVSKELSGDVVFSVKFLTESKVNVGETNEGTIKEDHLSVYRPKIIEDNGTNGPTTKFEIFKVLIMIAIIGMLFLFAGKRYVKKRQAERKQREAELEAWEQFLASQEQHLKFRSAALEGMHTFLNCLLILALIGAMTAVPVASACASERNLVMFLDISGSTLKMRKPAKEILANEVLRGGNPELWLFGDSTRFAKHISTLRELDSVFTSLPIDRNTRMTEAILFASRYTISLREKKERPCILFISDFDVDDNASVSLTYLPTMNRRRSDTLALANNLPPDSVNAIDMTTGIVLAIMTVIILGAVFTLIRKRNQQKIFSKVIVSNGRKSIEYKPQELQGKKLIIGNGVDADLKTFDGQEQVLAFESKADQIKLIFEHQGTDPLTISFHNGRK